ncbi:trypsin-like peptidase domain-containing protein [Yoonia sp.]|uniref:trypsin-like peptidase domain-containing protein n=1 Tax=Yoonia sp. TaxID=2212373 RepID=UPI00358E1CB7
MDQYSIRTVRLEGFTHETDKLFFSATGWLARKNRKIYLISNYHILDGRRVSDSKPFHPTGALPGAIRVHCKIIKVLPQGQPEVRLLEFIDINFTIDLSRYQLLWNSELRSDVAALDITHISSDFPDGYDFDAWDLDELSVPARPLAVMNELFIIGFPNTALAVQTNSPIYKSASIASEPETTKEQGYFLADGKTKPGMSGSPVILKDGLVGQPSASGYALKMGWTHLIGIYSGRDENDPELFTAELGKIWLLDETLLALLK